jgi:retron-type reverse transcriptase
MLNVMLEKQKTSWVLDADIKGFFDHLDHEWIVRFIESRIKDPNVTRLVRRLLKSGIMKDYLIEEAEEGSGQGSLCGARHKDQFVRRSLQTSTCTMCCYGGSRREYSPR